MSLSINFEPHSWYYGFVIQKTVLPSNFRHKTGWSAYIVDGNTYRIVTLDAFTLAKLRLKIVDYWLRDDGKHVPVFYAKRLLRSKK